MEVTLRWNEFGGVRRLSDADRDDLGAAEGDHGPPLPGDGSVNRRHSKTGGQHAIVGARHPAALREAKPL